MHPIRRHLLAASLSLLTLASQAADTLDPATRKQVISGVAKALVEQYRLPEQATQIAADLEARAQRGEYDSVASGPELAKRLTSDMQAISHDQHMSVSYRDKPRPRAAPGGPEEDRKINWGIKHAEVLENNVGYLRIDQFADAAAGGNALAGAMQFLANTDALIIDLRHNRGGGVMIMHLASYFFDGEPEVLQTIHFPRMGESVPYATVPWLPGPRYLNKPVYILTAKRTFSAGEAFAYAMQTHGRAKVVGEVTSGAANPNTFVAPHPNYTVSIPIGETIGAKTKSNWEGKGVQPDEPSPEADALNRALALIKAKS
ncbi:S41 family peptidase [Massilia sp. TS11]|uniref:S41 family peptidase n=1 Tax=Massilia sp. TS11 TaxID=2908003 RepID=UPI001EDBBE9E|nr:S41 family peptidase [Massilia sp. TS11]MCG2583548.1 S41 family peptidase [Massilia sp. TS11]